MNDSQIDAALGGACRAIGGAWEEKCRCCDEAVRRSPLLAVVCAAAAGYVLQFLPLPRMAGAAVKIGAGLLKPALLVYGAAKIVEYLRRSCPCASKPAS